MHAIPEQASNVHVRIASYSSFGYLPIRRPSLQLQPQNVPHLFLHLTCSCLTARIPRQSIYKNVPSDSFHPHMQRNFLKTSLLPLSHSTPFACISLFCPLVVIIIFAASPSRGQAADTKQVTAPLPAPATTHHLPYVAQLVLIKGSTIAPDSRHISLEIFQSLLSHRLARLASFYLPYCSARSRSRQRSAPSQHSPQAGLPSERADTTNPSS
ncbi:hypothetical protein CSIM01_06635 [Colletotrichum simmondsii]|uniref:Uncharacterized protein n=1 Tax=Colletotrichum simmondsii TaxID=703756 RepID=A0A135SUI2_9PEZI|nr:hypothetical protein CSIM01_06635 [Colletotrichum simmondsii]